MTSRNKRLPRTLVTRRGFFGEVGRFAAAAGFASLYLSEGIVGAAEPAAPSPSSVEEIRAALLLPKDLAYFNCGTLGPAPRSVIEESFHAWRKMEEDPANEGFGATLALAEQTRAKAAKLLACDRDEIVITRNTTDGMNTVAQGLDWRKGDRVLTTDQEHEGGSVCWKHFAKRSGVEIDRIRLPAPPESPREILKLLEAKLTRRTRVVSVSHVTFSTGLRMPVREIAALAKANGSLLVVDGAQAAGVLAVDVKALGCDAYCTSGHKWLLGPKGTGILYIRKESAAEVQPLLLDQGRSVYTTATGTQNLVGIIGLGVAIDFLAGVGTDKVQKRAMELAAYLYEKLKALPAVRIVSPAPGELSSPLVSVSLGDKVDNAALAARLREKHRIVVKVLPRDIVNGLRFSCHAYNTTGDCDRLAAALGKEP